MGFLDALAPFLDTAAQGVTAYDTGTRDRAAAEQESALAAIDRRAKDEAARRLARMDEARISLFRKQAEPDPVKPPVRRTQIVDGQLADLDTGVTRPLSGYTPPPKAPTGGGQVPVRGTKEYEDMLRREAAARASGGGGERGAQLPAPAIEKMIELDDLIGMTKRTRKSLAQAVNEGNNVTGRAGGVVPIAGWLRNTFRQGGDAGIGVRSELANVSSTIMKMRSGAAVSDQEFARLEPFLASDDDDESVAMVKLRKLATALEEMKRIRLENYQRYGKPGVQSRGTDPDTGIDLDEAIDNELGRRP